MDFSAKNSMYQSYEFATPNPPSELPQKAPLKPKMLILHQIYTFEHFIRIFFQKIDISDLSE